MKMKETGLGASLAFRLGSANANAEINLYPLERPLLNRQRTFFGHAHDEALSEATELTSVTRNLIDDAVLVLVARVLHVLLHATTEKSLRKKLK